MLASMPGSMLAEWQAYEMHAGPIGTMYADVTARTLVELVQQLNYLTGAQFKDNPVSKPSRFPDPVELITPPASEEVDEETEALRREDELMAFDAMFAVNNPQQEGS